MVRLEANKVTTCYDTPICFNSNMVRLEDNIIIIKPGPVICFNSNMVRLEDNNNKWSLVFDRRFNSNMVRLEAVRYVLFSSAANLFQFQYGAIRSSLRHIITPK